MSASGAAGQRAVQYLRMSTDHQRYSLENQAAAIMRYADAHGLEVVRSYSDAGKSGVSMKGREGLKALLADVVGGATEFAQILVFDVSRWGRFQDPDQAAHYEFICREAGFTVRYCSEPFENDGTVTSSIMKHIKRVMAGEFSRELSAKARFAQVAAAQKGLKQGGRCPFGVRRQLVDHDRKPIMLLGPGQHKALSSDRVVFVPGPEDEIRTLRNIFRWYGGDWLPYRQVLAKLNDGSQALPNGEPWTLRRLQIVVKNELYRGIYVFNKTRHPFGIYEMRNPEALWVRVRVFPPLVSRQLFDAASARVASCKRSAFTNDELLKRLRALKKKHGGLSHAIINSAETVPSVHTYVRRFGSLRKACELIGHQPLIYFNLRDDGGARTSEGYLLNGLRRLLATHGYLNVDLILKDPDLPSTSVFHTRFGGLPKAYRLAGWDVTHSEIVRAARRRGKERREADKAAHTQDLTTGAGVDAVSL